MYDDVTYVYDDVTYCTHLCTLDIDVHLGENNAFVVPLGERGVLGLERYTLSAPVDFQKKIQFFFS